MHTKAAELVGEGRNERVCEVCQNTLTSHSTDILTLKFLQVVQLLLAVDCGRLHEFREKTLGDINFNGVYHCEHGYRFSPECSVADIAVLSTYELPCYGLSDVRYMNCSRVLVYGDKFADSPNLTCHLQPVKVCDISGAQADTSSGNPVGSKAGTASGNPVGSKADTTPSPAVQDSQMRNPADMNGPNPVPASTTQGKVDDVPKYPKRRWTGDELSVLLNAFGKDITNKVMPASYRVFEVAEKLPERSIAQIRSQISNYIKSKPMVVRAST